MASNANESGQDKTTEELDDRTLEQMLEDGDVPDDPAELEARMGFDSGNKGQYADDKPSGDEGASDDNPKAKEDETSEGSPAEKEAGEKSDDPEQKTGEDEKTADEGGETSPQAGEKEGDGERTPDGVLTRDGKHVIPYNVLENARRKNQEAEERLQAMEEENRRLREQAQQTETKQNATQDQLDEAKRERAAVLDQHGIEQQDLPTKPDGTLDVESLRDEYPEEMVNVLVAHNNMVQRLSQQVESLQQDRQQQAQREQQIVRESIQDSIDATPELAEIQAEGGRRWNMAVATDADLREDPDWGEQPMRLRFQEVVHLMNGGKPRTPEQAEAELEASKPSTPDSKPDTRQSGDPRKAADERVAEAGRRAPPTHSDLPAGERPAQSGRENLETADPLELERQFANAEDPDELINRYLR